MRRIILILLMLAIAFSLCACVGENTGYTEAIKTTVESTESKTDTDQIVGTWSSEDALWFFDDNGGLRIIHQGHFPRANPDNYCIDEDTYNYSVDENVLSLFYGTQDNADIMIDRLIKFSGNNKLTLTDPERDDKVMELSRVKDSNGTDKTIIGTWIPFGYDSFYLSIGPRGYGAVEKLSFYNDGTFRVITQNGEGYGEYSFLFDGEVLQMRVGDHGEFDYELYGNEFMLLEFSDYHGEMQFSYLLKKDT